ncbi:MAG: hypothetical protein AAB795_02790 [Patescibacteria group bacterium]
MKEKIVRIANHPFLKYSWVGGLFSILNIVFVWLLIDIFHFSTLISTTFVVGCLFVAKYFAYKLTGFIG